MNLLKVRAGNYLVPLEIEPNGKNLVLKFRYNQDLIAEIKSMDGARWNPDGRFWSITNSSRNLFQLQFLSGQNPFKRYDEPLKDFTPRRKKRDGTLYERAHQIEMSAHAFTRHQCHFAAEMGTGKTLAAYEAMDQSGIENWLWVGPKSALYSVQLELMKWTCCDICGLLRTEHQDQNHQFKSENCVKPVFQTYDSLEKLIESWPAGSKPPKGVIFDEASRCKNPAAHRSQAARNLADEMRQTYGEDAWVVLMSGSPAPKSPLDWWNQCEIACPGFLKEGNIYKFQRRLAVVEDRDSTSGGVYPHLICWKDSVEKCDLCGQKEAHPKHDLALGGHRFKPCNDEVSLLYRRMKGLVLVKFKKDCLDLPDKQYQIIELAPTNEMQRVASIIMSKSPSTIQALTLLRELSDGFQYKDAEIGSETCYICKGTKTHSETIDLDDPENGLDALSIERGHRVIYDEDGSPIDHKSEPLRIGTREIACPTCNGTGQVIAYKRESKEVATPKERALIELLDQHEDVGRLVVYGGFQGSIDRIVRIVKAQGWDYIKADGRGWEGSIVGDPMQMLSEFQNNRIEKLVFIGQPGAAGMGLNLTASPSIVYYSNDFNAESRIQSEDRIHRLGMDVNRGATIYDLICLPTDMLVLNNLKRKRRLQDMTLGQMSEEIKAVKFTDIRSF